MRKPEQETILRWDAEKPGTVNVWTDMQWVWEQLEARGHKAVDKARVRGKVVGKGFLVSKREARALLTKQRSIAKVSPE